MTESPEARCEANIRAWLARKGMAGNAQFLEVRQDRAFLCRTAEFEENLRVLCAQGLLEKRYAGNHGADVVVGYREPVSRPSAQIILHADRVEFDFDYWNPEDVVSAIGHLWEITTNWLWKKKTDPFVIADGLKKRGIYG